MILDALAAIFAILLAFAFLIRALVLAVVRLILAWRDRRAMNQAHHG